MIDRGSERVFEARGARVVERRGLVRGMAAGALLVIGALYGFALVEVRFGVTWPVIAMGCLGVLGVAVAIGTYLRTYWGFADVAVESGKLILGRGSQRREVVLRDVVGVRSSTTGLGERVEAFLRGGEHLQIQLTGRGSGPSLAGALRTDGETRCQDLPLFDTGQSFGRWLAGGLLGTILGTVMAPILAMPTRFLLAKGPTRSFVGVLVVTLIVVAAGALGTRIATRTLGRVSIGSDGIAYRRGILRRQRFLPFSAIASMSLGTRTSGKRGVDQVLTVGLHRGRAVEIGAGEQGRVQAIAADIERARAAWLERARETFRVDELEPEGKGVAAWLATLEKHASADASYRATTLPFDRLADVVANPTAGVAQRLGAAVILASRGEEGARDRIRIAAAETMSPRVRAALESVARGAKGPALESTLALAIEEASLADAAAGVGARGSSARAR